EGKSRDAGGDGEGKGDDGRGRRAFGNARREQRNGADQQAVEQVAEKKVEGFGKVEVTADYQPNGERRGGGDNRGKPGAENRRHLGGDQRWNAIRQLHQKPQRARFFFAAKGANGDEGK